APATASGLVRWLRLALSAGWLPSPVVRRGLAELESAIGGSRHPDQLREAAALLREALALPTDSQPAYPHDPGALLTELGRVCLPVRPLLAQLDTQLPSLASTDRAALLGTLRSLLHTTRSLGPQSSQAASAVVKWMRAAAAAG